MDRKYLKLSYPESSFMEYPREWEERMNLWDEVINQVQKMEIALQHSLIVQIEHKKQAKIMQN